MSKDFCKKVWGLIYEEAEGHPPEGMRSVAGDKVAAEVNLVDIGSAFGAALDLTEGHPFGHAQRVAFIAQELAFSMGLDSSVVLDVTLAGLFHDIGLLRITHELNEITNETDTRRESSITTESFLFI